MYLRRIRNISFALMTAAMVFATKENLWAGRASAFCDDCAQHAIDHCGGLVCWTGEESGCNGDHYVCDEVIELCVTPCQF